MNSCCHYGFNFSHLTSSFIKFAASILSTVILVIVLIATIVLIILLIITAIMSTLPHAFSISVISSLTRCTKRGWGRPGRQPISGPQQYAQLGRAEKYARNSSMQYLSRNICIVEEISLVFQLERPIYITLCGAGKNNTLDLHAIVAICRVFKAARNI